MKRLMVSPITHTIYLTNVKEQKNGVFLSTGEKQDYTNEAVAAVYEWFLNQAKESDEKIFRIKYGDNPWLTMEVDA